MKYSTFGYQLVLMDHVIGRGNSWIWIRLPINLAWRI